MKRRDFIKLSTITAASLMMPTAAKAELTNPPLYIQIHAGGGWDPTMFCDPKPALNRLSMSVKQVSGTPIQYASINGGENIASFFETYGSELLVVNGVNAQGNGHTSGTQYTANGKIGAEYPVLTALLARIYTPGSGLGFIKDGNGYFNGQGIAVGVEPPRLSTFKKVLNPNLIKSTATSTYMQSSVRTQITNFRNARFSAKQSTESSDSVISKRAEQQALYSANGDLQNITITSEMENDEGFFSNIALAVDGYQKGLTSSILISAGSFDTHNAHDNDQLTQLNILFGNLNKSIAYVKSRIGNNFVLFVESEFGRTPSYNSNNGKDHWSTTSFLFMGYGINGGRVVGESTDRHGYTSINPVTLARDDSSSVTITPEHVHIALRELLGIANNSLCSDIYQLNPDLDVLPLFS